MKRMFSLLLIFSLLCAVLPFGAVNVTAQERKLNSFTLSKESTEDEKNSAPDSLTQLETPTGLVWDTSTPGVIKAKWNAVPNAVKYNVYLYKAEFGGNWYIKSLVTKNERDFATNIKNDGPGTYSFKVEALPADGSTSYSSSQLSAMSGPYTHIAAVCEIGSTKYYSLDEALAEVLDATPTTIKLLTDITYTTPLVISNKSITFDLNSYGLVIDTRLTMYSTALRIENGGSVDYTGQHSLIIRGNSYGVYMDGGTATVTSVSASDLNMDSYGAYVENGGELMIAASVSAARCGAYAESGGKITIGEDAVATLTIPNDSFGARAHAGGIITIGGKAYAEDRAIYVSGLGSIITVGSVESGAIDINHHRKAVQVESMGQAFIHGDCTVNSVNGTAVFVSSNGEVTIDGMINHNGIYIMIYTTEIDGSPASRTIPTTKSGYHTYSTENGTVWVKNTTVVTLPSILTNPVTDISSTAATLNGTISWDGGDEVTEHGFVYSTSANPQIETANIVKAGSGTGNISMAISGLTPNTSYHVRAYAINSAGTAYGEDVSFNTQPVVTPPPVTPPPVTPPIVIPPTINPPTAPQEFTATPGNGQVVLGWKEPVSNGGSAIIHYEVSGDNGDTWVIADSNTGHTFTDLSNDQSYTFQVRAVNSVGYGADASVTATLTSLSPEGGDTSSEISIPNYKDVKKHWARKDIKFVASRGLITGTTATTFSPDKAITRADFIMALGKLSGVDVSGYKKSSFFDVENNDPAMPYIEWAVENGIIKSIGSNLFGPDLAITREQMVVIMVRYAKIFKYTLPELRQAQIFVDNEKISSWAKASVKALQQSGIIKGKKNKLFDPQGKATRAEASAILHRFVKLFIG